MSGPQKESMAARILRAALERLPDQDSTVTSGEISSAMMVQTRRQHKRLLNHLGDIVKAGRLARVKNGVYRLPDHAAAGKPEIRQVMWRLLRMRRRVTVADLVEMAGASESYAEEWLRMLAAKGVVRRYLVGDQPAVWQLISAVQEMPENDGKAARLRAHREKVKNEVVAALNDISEAMGKVRQAIRDL